MRFGPLGPTPLRDSRYTFPPPSPGSGLARCVHAAQGPAGGGVRALGRGLGVHRIHIVLRRGSPREGALVDAQGLTGDRGGRKQGIGHQGSFPGGARLEGSGFRAFGRRPGGGAGGLQVRPASPGRGARSPGQGLLATRKTQVIQGLGRRRPFSPAALRRRIHSAVSIRSSRPAAPPPGRPGSAAGLTAGRAARRSASARRRARVSPR